MSANNINSLSGADALTQSLVLNQVAACNSSGGIISWLRAFSAMEDVAASRMTEMARSEAVEEVCMDRSVIHGRSWPNGHETILLVEPDVPLLTMLARVLEYCGFVVLAVGSGGAAADTWRVEMDRIQLLLVDPFLLEISAEDLAEALKREKPGLKTIFLSGCGAESFRATSSLIEGVNFVRKPFGAVTLVQTVRNCLDRRD